MKDFLQYVKEVFCHLFCYFFHSCFLKISVNVLNTLCLKTVNCLYFTDKDIILALPVPSSRIMIDPESSRNEQRRQFCMKYEGYTEFCNRKFSCFLSPMLIYLLSSNINKHYKTTTLYFVLEMKHIFWTRINKCLFRQTIDSTFSWHNVSDIIHYFN